MERYTHVSIYYTYSKLFELSNLYSIKKIINVNRDKYAYNIWFAVQESNADGFNQDENHNNNGVLGKKYI